jgi:hypothetical protein
MKRGVSSGRATGELKSLVVGLLVVLILASVVTALATAFAASVGREFEDLSRDPAAVGNLPNYIGYYANLTIYLWQIPGSAAILASVLLRYAGHRRLSWMFLTGGAITCFMALDDFFMIHETLSETLHLSQKAEPIAYALAIGAWTWVYRRTLRWNIALVVVAMGFWGISAALDALDLDGFVAEDGAKLFGVAVWTFMMMRLVLRSLREVTLRTPDAVARDEWEDDDFADLEDDEPEGYEEVPRAHRQEPVLAGAAVRAERRADGDPATTPISVVPRQGPRGEGRRASQVSATTRLPSAVSGTHRLPSRPIEGFAAANGTRPRVNGHGTNGHATNGHATNGHSTNGHSTNGHSGNGHRANGHRTNGYDTGEHRTNGHGVNGNGHRANGYDTGEHRTDGRHTNGGYRPYDTGEQRYDTGPQERRSRHRPPEDD